MSKLTLVIGASLKTIRYSNMAIKSLVKNNFDVVAIGLKLGDVAGVPVLQMNNFDLKTAKVHTVTLYLNAKRQMAYYDFIISLQPKRVIFNPGTENEDFYTILRKHTISYEESCTLVLLNTKQY
ncbi:MAG: CoA-binding protein [Flavobacteriaceae bacterium]